MASTSENPLTFTLSTPDMSDAQVAEHVAAQRNLTVSDLVDAGRDYGCHHVRGWCECCGWSDIQWAAHYARHVERDELLLMLVERQIAHFKEIQEYIKRTHAMDDRPHDGYFGGTGFNTKA